MYSSDRIYDEPLYQPKSHQLRRLRGGCNGFVDASRSAPGSCNFELSSLGSRLRSDRFSLLLGFAYPGTDRKIGKKVNMRSLASAVRARYFFLVIYRVDIYFVFHVG